MLTLTIISNKLLTTNKTQQTNKEIKTTKKKKNYMRRQFQNWILFFCLLQNHLGGFESDDML